MSQHQKILSPIVVVQVLVFVVLVPLLPLLISCKWRWWEAWVFAALYILGFAISRILAARRHPELIAERARSLCRQDAEPWDRLLAPLATAGGALTLVIAGLDGRFAWSPAVSLPIRLLSLTVLLAGYALGSYALIENPFFSGVVRIQAERGHRVVSSGPYRWIRHPGYAGGLLTYLATPPFLGTLWAFIPVALLAVVLVIRTALEDRTLRERLEGYREYARQVRYRLVPGVW